MTAPVTERAVRLEDWTCAVCGRTDAGLPLAQDRRRARRRCARGDHAPLPIVIPAVPSVRRRVR